MDMNTSGINQSQTMIHSVEKAKEAVRRVFCSYSGSLAIRFWNGETVDFIPLMPSHTGGDTVVRFRAANVIYIQDFYRNFGYPFSAHPDRFASWRCSATPCASRKLISMGWWMLKATSSPSWNRRNICSRFRSRRRRDFPCWPLRSC